jgi:hypothetical protein
MVNDVRQRELYTAEPLGPEPKPLSLRWLLEIYLETNHQVLNKSQQN